MNRQEKNSLLWPVLDEINSLANDPIVTHIDMSDIKEVVTLLRSIRKENKQQLKDLSATAREFWRRGNHVDYLRKNTAAVLANSKQYKVGQIVKDNSGRSKHGSPCAFITSLRWSRRKYTWGVFSGYGGYLVMYLDGSVATCAHITEWK